jgi:hypothetical protein
MHIGNEMDMDEYSDSDSMYCAHVGLDFGLSSITSITGLELEI